MSRKSSKKATKPTVTELAPKNTGAAYPVEQTELDAQNERLKKAAAAGAGALNSASPAQPASPEPATPEKPLTKQETVHMGTATAKTAPNPVSAPVTQKLEAARAESRVMQTETPRSNASGGKSPSAVESQKGKVTFSLVEPSARHVSLRGDFNGWSAEATPMKRCQDGHWEASVTLAPGRYEYKFFVDGQWVPDPQARENVWNYHGTLNSVVVV